MGFRKRRRNSKVQLSAAALLLGILVFFSFAPQIDIGIQNISVFLFLFVPFGVCVGIFLMWRIDSYQRRQLRALRISEVDTMTGVQFERYIGGILISQNYSVTYTPSSNDYGVDIIARRDGRSYALQLKRYKGSLGSSPIREVVAGMNYYSCNKCAVVTNSYFSSSAKKLARVNGCILVDRPKLAEWIESYQQGKKFSNWFVT